MILLIGAPVDPALARLRQLLRRTGVQHLLLDERALQDYAIEDPPAGAAVPGWTIRGAACTGRRRVGVVFVRHWADVASPAALAAEQRRRRPLRSLLVATSCLVVNRPSLAWANFCKPAQLAALAAQGFEVPRTLVSNDPRAALQFVLELEGRVVVKGVSSAKTFPRVVGPWHIQRMDRLRQCPAQFQELIDGDDVRVTVVGEHAFATRMLAGQPARAGPADDALPREIVQRCVSATRAEGLVMSGIDLRCDAQGQCHALELNPFPKWTHYESREDPIITMQLARYLAENQNAPSDVWV